jgi:phosphomethylpyrimidine synthase
MKITQDVRDYAARLNEQSKGMAEMSGKFKEMGANLYVSAGDGVDVGPAD